MGLQSRWAISNLCGLSMGCPLLDKVRAEGCCGARSQTHQSFLVRTCAGKDGPDCEIVLHVL